MNKVIRRIGIPIVVCAVVVWVILRLIFGGGSNYENLSTNAEISSDSLQLVLSHSEPIGNIAVSIDGRIFFSIHPESNPKNKLMEWADGRAIPFPNLDYQEDSLNSVLGVMIDAQNRLWVLDNGFHGVHRPSITAFNLKTGKSTY